MAEIALGVIPLIGTTFAAYRYLHKQLKAFKQYGEDFDRTCQELALHRTLFKLECWILLRSALGDARITELKVHERWDHREINDEFQRNLQTSYELCYSTIRTTKTLLRELEDELQEFSSLVEDRQKIRSLSDGVRHLRMGAKLTRNREKYANILERLGKSNNDLKNLANCIKRLQQPYTNHRKSLVQGGRHRGDWSAARKAHHSASVVYKSLEQAFTCEPGRHEHHIIQLFVNKPKQEDAALSRVNISTSLALLGKDMGERQLTRRALHIHVNSIDMQWIENDTLSPPASLTQLMINDPEPSRKRLKTVECRNENNGSASPSATNQIQPFQVSSASNRSSYDGRVKDLARVSDLCGHLAQQCLLPVRRVPRCIGFLKNTDCVRHEFFQNDRRPHIQCDESLRLGSLAGEAGLQVLDDWQKLQVARAVATTALTYINNPWMKGMWRLNDIRFLRSLSSAEDVSSLLKTLHLEVDLASRRHLLPFDTSARDLISTPPESEVEPSDDDCLRHGIGNKTAHSLAMALVGIERSCDYDPANMDHVQEVRDYLMSDMRLGPKYEQIVDQCFATRSRDLYRQSQRHKKIFEDVIGVLETMVAATSLDDTE